MKLPKLPPKKDLLLFAIGGVVGYALYRVGKVLLRTRRLK